MLRKFNIFRFFKKMADPIFFQSRLYSINGKDFFLRQARIEDIKELLEVERLIYQGETPWEKSAFFKELLSKQKHLYLVMVVEEKIIAFAGIRLFLSDGHVTNVAVHPAYQNQSIGKILIEQLESFANKEGCQTLSLEVRRSNIDAQRFYRFCGFESVRVKFNYYDDIKEDAIDMVKKL